MKRLNRKSVVLAAVALLLGGGAYLNYQMAQRAAESQMSDLTLANLEAMAWDLDDSDNPDMDLDGEGIMANKCCPIWNVTYEASWSGPTITCSTGGSYKCEDCRCKK